MKHQVTLTITSLLSILFLTFHLSDDIVRGFEPGAVSNVTGILILVTTTRTTKAARVRLKPNTTTSIRRGVRL